MEENILLFFNNYSSFAIVISLILNILLSIAGIIPSFFLTVANIIFFGFWTGTLISYLGEVLGAGVSFLIYRKGINKFLPNIHRFKYDFVRRLVNVKGREAFSLILGLRLLPYIPSGFVNLFAALGKVSFTIFIAATSIGKIPALLLEAYSVLQITKFTWQGKIILTCVSLYFLVMYLRKYK